MFISPVQNMQCKDFTRRQRDIGFRYDYDERRMQGRKSPRHINSDRKQYFYSTALMSDRYKMSLEKRTSRPKRFGSPDYQNHEDLRKHNYQSICHRRNRANLLEFETNKIRNTPKYSQYQNRLHRAISQQFPSRPGTIKKQYLGTFVNQKSSVRSERSASNQGWRRVMSQTSFERDNSRQVFNKEIVSSEIFSQNKKNHFDRQPRYTNANKPKPSTKTPNTQTPKTPLQPHERVYRKTNIDFRSKKYHEDLEEPTLEHKYLSRHSPLKYVTNVRNIRQKPFWFKSKVEQKTGCDLKDRITRLLNKQ